MRIIILAFVFLSLSISVLCQSQDSDNNKTKDSENLESKTVDSIEPEGSGRGSESTSASGIGNGKDKLVREKNSGVFIVSKPQPRYTDKARLNQTEGKVILVIEFKKNGKIGKIEIVSGLSDGLNEKAVEAAKEIRFLPEMKNGKPKSVKKKVQFTFKLI